MTQGFWFSIFTWLTHCTINMAYKHTWFNKGLFESENILTKEYKAIDSLYKFTTIIKTWYFKNSYLILIHVNPYFTLKNVHTKRGIQCGSKDNDLNTRDNWYLNGQMQVII